MTNNKKAIRLFLLIVIIVSAIIEGIIIYLQALGISVFLMWVPAIAAWITKVVYFPKEKHSLGFQKCKIKYILAALAIPLIYIGIPYVIYWIAKPGSLEFEPSPVFYVTLVMGVPISMITAIGEEIGWRGFLVPRLVEEVGTTKTLLITSGIWCLWHMPILASGLYMPGTPLWYKIPLFIITIGATGFIIGILTLKSQSVWPAAVLHAAHNDYDQALFGMYTVGEDKMYFVSETGMITAVVVVIIAAVMYVSFKKQDVRKA